ncbi:ABC transporter substrate-binding protein [Oxalobacteraceae bacterium R-40]|uniref:ABC transporter substrate-binding protein n=1 Tax=Keguizhuia sedimenti TaxID=3064264 RepID=A0ABU1BS39_9BURK|nr:ABC transporter substrate-binding protein [Oxalobacteraceae bacterium R-40]
MKTPKQLSKFLFTVALAFGAMFLAQPASAQEAPDVLVKRLSHEILEIIKSDKELKAGNPRRVQEVVTSKLLPHLNFRKTTSMTVGRHWREATPEQQEQLTEEFRNLLIYTYSGALSQVGDQKLEIRPLRGPVSDDVEVRTYVIQSGREPVEVNYRLEKTPEGWKIYDVSVFGAWLTEAYKNTFSAEVSRGGIEGLLRTLQQKNRQLATNTKRPHRDGG